MASGGLPLARYRRRFWASFQSIGVENRNDFWDCGNKCTPEMGMKWMSWKRARKCHRQSEIIGDRLRELPKLYNFITKRNGRENSKMQHIFGILLTYLSNCDMKITISRCKDLYCVEGLFIPLRSPLPLWLMPTSPSSSFVTATSLSPSLPSPSKNVPWIQRREFRAVVFSPDLCGAPIWIKGAPHSPFTCV